MIAPGRPQGSPHLKRFHWSLWKISLICALAILITTIILLILLFRPSNDIAHYEYVIHNGTVDVYDIDHHFNQVKQFSVPSHGERGVVVDPATHVMYISYGGISDASGGALLAYDLVNNHVLYNVTYDHGADSMSITPDGKTIYMPEGEGATGNSLYIINSSNGVQRGVISVGQGPHDILVSLDGTKVYAGSSEDTSLYVVSTATNTVISKVGPFIGAGPGTRPFTISSGNTYVFTDMKHFLGFYVGDITTGKMLYKVQVQGFTDPPNFTGEPSHGITLTPDSRYIYNIDAGNNYVHVFDTKPMPSSPPKQIADIRLNAPCNYGCGGSGWLQTSIDGRYIFVGNYGDVIDTTTNTVVANISSMSQTKIIIEVDWQHGIPVATSGRTGMGFPSITMAPYPKVSIQ